MDMRRLKNDKNDDNEDIAEKKRRRRRRGCACRPFFKNPSNTAHR